MKIKTIYATTPALLDQACNGFESEAMYNVKATQTHMVWNPKTESFNYGAVLFYYIIPMGSQ